MFHRGTRSTAHTRPPICLWTRRPRSSSTGGTSGVPKGVMQPYRAWNTNIVSQQKAYNFTSQDRYLVNAPLTHGASTYILPILGAGGAFVFPEDTKPAALLNAQLRSTRSRHSSLHPQWLRCLSMRCVRQIYERLRCATSFAAVRRCGRHAFAKHRRPSVQLLPAHTGKPRRRRLSRSSAPPRLMDEENLASVGRPSLLTEVGIMDSAGNLLPRRRAGRDRCAWPILS